MPNFDLYLSCPLYDTFRVRQIAGMFDLDLLSPLEHHIRAEIPSLDAPWQIGAIVGPSASGKSTLARHAFGDCFYQSTPWPTDKAVIDSFGDLPIKQITRVLTAVGFSSPPAWVRPFATLSTGEQFRCELARALLAGVGSMQKAVGREDTAHPIPPTAHCLPPTVAFDEFTSVVDRDVARIASLAISKAIRNGIIVKRFVAVTCHSDVIPWLQPDWVLDMSDGKLTQERLRPVASKVESRPKLSLRIRRCDRSLWNLFARHHYLNNDLHPSAMCFLGSIDNRPATFVGVLPFPHPLRPGWREHRLVCLPDYQGIGIGAAMSDFVASLFIATGKPYFSRTSHPAMIHHRINSRNWRMIRRPGMVSRSGPASTDKTRMSESISRGRNTCGFEYVGKERGRHAVAFGL